MVNFKVMNVFYGEDLLPYKDKERSVHYPIIGNSFLGASNVTEIHFYIDRIGDIENVWVANSKLPNGLIGNEILAKAYDEELDENYVVLKLSTFYTQAKGDLYISLNAFVGGVEIVENDGIYAFKGTPTIQATGSVKIAIHYATPLADGDEVSKITLQQLMGAIAEYVPYVGANKNVDLGTHTIKSSGAIFNNGTSIGGQGSNAIYFAYNDTEYFVVSSNGVLGIEYLNGAYVEFPNESGTIALKSDITNSLNNYVNISTDQRIAGTKTFLNAVNFDSLIYTNYGEFRFNNHVYFTDNTENHNRIIEIYNDFINVNRTLTCKNSLNVDGLIYAGGNELRFNDHLDITNNEETHGKMVTVRTGSVNLYNNELLLGNKIVWAANNSSILGTQARINFQVSSRPFSIGFNSNGQLFVDNTWKGFNYIFPSKNGTLATVDDITSQLPNNIANGSGEKSLKQNTIDDTQPNVSSGDESVAFNHETKAVQKACASFGGGTVAGDDTVEDASSTYGFAFAIGELSKAKGRGSFASGNTTEAKGMYSSTFGYKTVADYDWQMVGGALNNPNEDALFIIGNGGTDEDNVEFKNNAFLVFKDGHAEVDGQGNTDKSVVIKQSVSTDLRSGTGARSVLQVHSSNSNTAPGQSAIALGSGTNAKNDRSMTMGIGTISGMANSLTTGRYNVVVNNALLTVGNGSSNNAKSNAFVVYNDGVISIPNFDSNGTKIGMKRIKCINGELKVID